MTKLVLATILSLWCCRSFGQVTLMTQNKPFPYVTGAALDQGTYDAVKAKLEAADALKNTSEAAIAALKDQISALEGAISAKNTVLEHDKTALEDLQNALSKAKEDLKNAQDSVAEAVRITEKAKAILPRRIRKKVQTPAEIAYAVVDYTETLQRRPLRYGLAGLIIGFTATLSLTL